MTRPRPQQPFIYGPLRISSLRPMAFFFAIISNSAPPIRNTTRKRENTKAEKGERERGGSFTFALVHAASMAAGEPHPHSIPSQSLPKTINHGDRACLLFGKMGSEGRKECKKREGRRRSKRRRKEVSQLRKGCRSVRDLVSFCERRNGSAFPAF